MSIKCTEMYLDEILPLAYFNNKQLMFTELKGKSDISVLSSR